MIIFGAGVMGKIVYQALKDNGCTVEAFIDNSTEAQGRNFDGVPIKSPEDFCGTNHQVVIAVVGQLYSVLEDLKRLNINNYAAYTDILSPELFGDAAQSETARMNAKRMSRIIAAFNKGVKPGLELFSIDVVVTESCTLRCRDCSNLMQYFSNPRESDFEKTIQSFDRLYSLCDWIDEVRIIGGDAMIARKLPEYINYFTQLERISEIVIYTNGILMPKQELLSVLTDNRISFHTTDYGNPKQRINELKDIMDSNGIRLRTTYVNEWQDCAKIYHRDRSIPELRDTLRQCCASQLTSLKDGKIWRCPLSASLAALRAMPLRLWQYVDLTGNTAADEVMRDSIINLMSLDFLYACDYCGGRPRVNDSPITPAIQITRSLEYVAEP